jgi:hypothetical protein
MEFELDSKTLTTEAEAVEDVEYAGTRFRLPTSCDVAAVALAEEPEDAARQLIERCCLDEAAAARVWNTEDASVIGELMAAADPLSDVSLSFVCPACAHAFEESLDLAAHLWTEIDGRVRRLLLEVHQLATAYGWSESEILAVPAARRAVYLAMVGA